MVNPISATPPPRSAADLFSDPLDAHPLWLKPALFLSPNFDTESYISELRTFVPFDTLRSELQSHLAALHHELIDLSTKLVDVDAAIVRMRAPLLELREKIEGFRGSVEQSLVSLRNGLRQRSEAREVMELLLDTFHVVSKNLPFIENMEKRFKSASLLLDASLGHCFVDGLDHRDANAIYNCLRAYAATDNTRSAEEVFRTTTMAPLIQKIIIHGSSGEVAEASRDELDLKH